MRKVKGFIVFVLALLLVGCGKSPSLSAENLTLEVGEEKQLLFSVKDTKNDVIFNMEDNTVASISDVGLVKGLKVGTTTLTVSVKNTDLKKIVTIEVKAVAVEITLEASGPEKLTVGETGKIVVTTNDSLGVNYTSSDSEILAVDEAGNINALKAGNVVITVESKTDNEVKKTVAIEVEEKLVINISSIDDFDVIEGEEKLLDVVHNDPLGVIITSSDASIVSVNNLTITAKKVGTVILTITSKTDDSVKIEVEVTIVEKPYIIVPNNEIALNINEEFDFEFDASHDVLIVVSDESIISLDKGIIIALKEGVATITLSLKDYPSIKEIVTVTVYPDIVVEGIIDLKISVGESKEIPFTSLNDLTFTSSDKTIFTIENNVITGVKSGTAKIIITSIDNPAFSLEVEVVILGMPTRVTLTAERELVIGEETLIVTNFTPLNTFSPMRFESSNESVLTVDENGLVTAVGGGKATVTATSIIEPLLNAKISFTVELINAVKPDLKEGETIEANGFSFKQGLNAFNTLEEALVGSPKEIIMVGEYNDEIIISQPIVLSGTTNTLIKNVVTINSSNITFKGFNFSGAGKIVVNEGLENVVLSKNKFNNLNYKTAPIYAERQKNLEISYNTLNLNKGVGIEVFNPTGNIILVKGNTITNATTAVVVKATENYSTTLSVQVMWNKIDNVDLGFDIDLAYQEEINHAKSYVRFNELTNYVNAVVVPSVNKLDFNLNYWGGTPELIKFVNLVEDDLDGFYLDKTEILPEELYSPNGPSYVKILTELVEVDIDEEITVQIKVLPKDIQTSSYQLLTGDATTMTVDSSYTIRFKKSGFVELILRSVVNTSIEHRVRFEVIANPGIEIIPEEAHNQILVGDTLKFDTIVFPKRYENEPVVFSVDNNNIATIDEKGVLTAVGAGLVTIKVERASNHEIYQIFRLEIYDELDENNIMDFIASSILIYTTPRSFLTYGGTNILYESYDSVSRIIFEELYRNKEKMMPVCGTLSGSQKSNCEKLRPGTRPAIPSNVQTYNNKNVHYVTFHETGNTNPNQGALSHANYLINQVNGTTELRQASWHFTIDDKELYQHLPTDEMAWHAGDGTRLAGTTWSDTWGNQNIGGGNTHSIAIESSVARTDDILRVWQRGAKLIAQLTKEYNLPKENVKFHYDFSSKICPQSMIMANLTGYFYEFVAYEYKLHHDYEDAVIVFTSHDPEYVDHAGRVIKLPDVTQNVSFTIRVTYKGEVLEKTFYSYLPGTIH